MRKLGIQLRSPVIISSLLVLPLVYLEVTNRRGFGEGFPFTLFATLWALPVLFLLTLIPMVRKPRADRVRPVTLVPRVVFLLVVAWLWAGILLDQMPCFLGVPNCD